MIDESKFPENLPLIERVDLKNEDGSFKLNPFMLKGQKLRIVGYDSEAEAYSIKNETTGEFKWKDESFLNKACRVWVFIKFQRSGNRTQNAVRIGSRGTWIPRKFVNNWPQDAKTCPKEIIAQVPEWFLRKHPEVKRYIVEKK